MGTIDIATSLVFLWWLNDAQNLSLLGQCPVHRRKNLALMVILSVLLAPYLAHLNGEKDVLFYLDICLHWINQTQVYTRLKCSVKPAFKSLWSPKGISYWAQHLCRFMICCVFKCGAVNWFKYFIGQFYCSRAPGLFKAGTNFLNQIDKCKVIALDITAA